MQVFTLETLVALARERSPYYRKLYRDLPRSGWRLRDLPIIDLEDFWAVNDFNGSQVYTDTVFDGLIGSTTGTTGSPKVIPYTREEWRTTIELVGRMFWMSGVIKPGQRVANLATAVRLYTSHLFVHDALQVSPIRCLELAMSSNTTVDFIADAFDMFRPEAAIGMVVPLLNIGTEIAGRSKTPDYVSRLLCGGEIISDDQLAYFGRVYPNARICGSVYATHEAGILGLWDESCGPQEMRVYDECALLEIVDASGNPIEEEGQPGTVIATSLTKSLMPAIRYPTGDRGVWAGPPGPGRKFRLMGRAQPRLYDIGGQTIDVDDLGLTLSGSIPEILVLSVQLVQETREGAEVVTMRISHAPRTAGASADVRAVEERVRMRVPAFTAMERSGAVSRFKIELASPMIEVSGGLGKLQRVIDRRGRA
ncbi:phenylacetate--CoA ligase family protein [Myxococcus virescens]|uniref:phenylacetate--CoA ligase family protein n=1 Tax=Myxococcus virescens TaxID=83456 RepID=UPI003DA682FF